MSSACGCESPETTAENEEELPWYRDWHVLIPIISGVFFLAGLVLEWTTSSDTAEVIALVLFWVGLLLGAYTFVPSAVRNLFSKRKIGIGLLMTISATGAVIMGYVEEAAALAFLYSIAEALESCTLRTALLTETGPRNSDGDPWRCANRGQRIRDSGW